MHHPRATPADRIPFLAADSSSSRSAQPDCACSAASFCRTAQVAELVGQSLGWSESRYKELPSALGSVPWHAYLRGYRPRAALRSCREVHI